MTRRPDPRQTQAQGETQLRLLLMGATDERVAGFTVDALCRMYPVKEQLVETLLLAEQDKRRRRAAND